MSAVSPGYSKVFVINKASFLEVLKEEPEDFVKFKN
jgi:hypothetical protein